MLDDKLVLFSAYFSASEGFRQFLSFLLEFITSPSLVSRCEPSNDILDKKLMAANLLLDCCLLTRVAI